MSERIPQKPSKVIKIDDDQIQQHLIELVRWTVEETLNKVLDAEADHLAKYSLFGFKNDFIACLVKPASKLHRSFPKVPLNRIIKPTIEKHFIFRLAISLVSSFYFFDFIGFDSRERLALKTCDLGKPF